jgi:hypothetical protein
MILPTKGVSPNRALITLGADVLSELRPSSLSVSALWERVQVLTQRRSPEHLSFDWFILSLDFLFSVGAIEADSDGLLHVASR